jgi:magnesium-transporting ATPase (P-type)
MEQLNDDQVTIILNRIIADGVTNDDLQNNLLDHYCCFIEERLSVTTDFESAYKIAFENITPNGMHEIQQELYFILNFNKQIIMKRIIYLSGFLTAFFISTGILFKMMHWPGNPIVSSTGFILLIFTAVVLFFNSVKHRKSHSSGYNARVIIGFISALLIASGNIFRILELEGGSVLFTLGMVLLSFVFLPMFFYHLYQKAVENTSKPLSEL